MAVHFDDKNPMHQALRIQERQRPRGLAMLLTQTAEQTPPESGALSQMPADQVPAAAAKAIAQADARAASICRICLQPIGRRGCLPDHRDAGYWLHPSCADNDRAELTPIGMNAIVAGDAREMVRPVPNCEHANDGDGLCSHPRNMTPECHDGACPRVDDNGNLKVDGNDVAARFLESTFRAIGLCCLVLSLSGCREGTADRPAQDKLREGRKPPPRTSEIPVEDPIRELIDTEPPALPPEDLGPL